MTDTLQWRTSWRRLAASPGFTGTALLMLAIGVGATLTVFAIVNAVLLRPLPVPESDRLVTVSHVMQGNARRELTMSDALYFLYADESRTLDGLAGVREGYASFTDPGNP